jgi:hypothetical protein
VNLTDLSEVAARESLGNANHSRPKPAVNVGDLAVDEAADQDLVGIADCPREGEDLLASWVRPPAPVDRFAGEGVGEGGHQASTGFEHDAMLSDERECLTRGHEERPFISLTTSDRGSSDHAIVARTRPASSRA